jgi:hypothetical protein
MLGSAASWSETCLTRRSTSVREVLIVEVAVEVTACWRLRTSRSTRVRVFRASVVARLRAPAPRFSVRFAAFSILLR